MSPSARSFFLSPGSSSALYLWSDIAVLSAVEETPAGLPPEFFTLTRRAVSLVEADGEQNPPHAFGFAYRLPALIIRFYEQTKDEGAKKICLDVLVRILALGWGEAASELSSIDR